MPILAIGILLAAARGVTGQPVTPRGVDPCCPGEEEAKKAFDHAADILQRPPGALLRNQQLGQARDDLCRASCCWPEPDPEPRSIAGFARVPYAPFYYMGLYYRETDDPCNALENLNLSECKGEITTASRAFSSEELERFREKRDKVRDWAVSRRPGKFPDLVAALDAYPRQGQDDGDLDRQELNEAARRVRRAIEHWDEDGGVARLQGRFLDKYLPRYYLASLLYSMDCFEEAVSLIKCSEISRCQFEKAARDEAGRIEAILRLGAERIEEGYEEPEICDEWRPFRAGECCLCVQCARP